MAFSLSPSISVREYDLSQYVPNLPSSRTGAVLRADKGPIYKIVSITNESELVNTFGRPTAYNYQDWFQCWNFLQYASSLYVVRPGDNLLATKNAGINITGNVVDQDSNEDNLYNKDVAEHTLKNYPGISSTLYLWNRDVTSEQNYAVAICSSQKNFRKQLGLEYFAVISNAVSSTSVTADGKPTLVRGSKVILNGGKLATVNSVTQTTGTEATIVFNQPIVNKDIDPYFGVLSAAASGTTIEGAVLRFKKDSFTLKRGTVLSLGASGTGYVDVIGLSTNELNVPEYVVTLKKIVDGSFSYSAAAELSSNTQTLFGKTAFNIDKGDFGIDIGTQEISLMPGFVLEEGTEFSLGALTGLIVSSVDLVNNKIRLVEPAVSGVSASGSISLIVTSPTTLDRTVTGINLFENVYDDGMIVKEKKKLLDPTTGKMVTIFKESLVTFERLVEFEPIWTKDEFVIAVLAKNREKRYEIAEVFTCSYNTGNRDSNGRTNFVEDVFFNTSKTLYVKVGNPNGDKVDTTDIQIPKILGDSVGGTTIYPKKLEYGKYVYDGYGYDKGDIQDAQAMFADAEQFDINLLISHQLDLNGMSEIAMRRKDCVAIVAPYDSEYISTASNSDASYYLVERYGTQQAFAEKDYTAFGTYSAIYANMKYQYDKWNDINRWICVAGDVAGLYAQTDADRDPWWAPAGSERGKMRNVIKLAFNPNKQNRDDLYVNALNPIISIPGEGAGIVFGQKTATAKSSAFDRVNVRRLLIFIEKAIATASRAGLFEFNDAFTRARLYGMIEPFLREVKARRGLYDYLVVIDDTNNTSEIIDNNGLVIDVYLKPVKVAEFIQVNAIVVKTGVSFSEVVGQY